MSDDAKPMTPENRTKTPREVVANTLSFFGSCIRCGEPWDDLCQKMMDSATAALANMDAPVRAPTDERSDAAKRELSDEQIDAACLAAWKAAGFIGRPVASNEWYRVTYLAGYRAAPAADAVKREGLSEHQIDTMCGGLSRILHEMAGAASLCWIPSPSGEFDASRASEFVSAAIAEIRAALAAPVSAGEAISRLADLLDGVNDPETRRDACAAARDFLARVEPGKAKP